MSTVANHEQFDAWNGDSGARWVASADRRDRVLAPVAKALLDAARPAEGRRVLDVGCGCGATTLAVAERLGPDGSVTGWDLSAPMLAVARRRAEEAAISNVTFVQADAQTHDPTTPVDLVVSRFGTMFFADPVAAFTNLHRALDPGGRLCLATWQPLARNEWLTVPGSALLQHTELPDAGAGAAGMFAQSDPDTVRGVLGAAGFGDIELDAVTLTLTFGATVDAAVDHLADSGPGRMILETIDEADRAAALASVADALGPHRDEQGVHLDAAVWIIRAARAG